MSQLLQNAVYGAALILAATILRRVLRDRLIPEARLALWAVCLFRLLTPAAPESVLSLWGLTRLLAPEKQNTPAPSATVFIPAAVNPVPAPQPAGPETSWETVLMAVWLAVGAAMAVHYVIFWRRTRRAVSCAVPLDRSDARYASLPKCARLREGPMEGAPLTFGVLRPIVVLSPGLDGPELDCVLAHEGVHASRRDNLWHYAMALTLAVHWWNPAVWLMSRLLRWDIELSCDRAAVKKLGADRRADYANALVSLATQTEGPAFCHTFGRKAAEERIRSVMKFKKTSVIGVIFTLALVLAVTMAFASNPKEPDEDSTTFSDKGGKAWSMSTDANHALKHFSIDLDYLQESLAEHVADGSMTQEEADRVLALARAAAQGRVELDWTFPHDSGLVDNSFPDGVYQPGFNVCYKDPDGNLIPLDPATVVSSFIFPASAGNEDLPTYVEDNGSILFDEGSTLDSYDVHIPTFDEDGSPEDNGFVAQRMMELDEYKTLLDNLVASRKVIQADADQLYTGAKQALEMGGEATALYANDSGSYAIMTAPLCYLADCEDHTPHSHGAQRYSGHCSVPCTQMDCMNEGGHFHNGVPYDGTLAVCTLSDCGNNSVHSHDGITYKGWTGKLPASTPAPAAPAPAVSSPVPTYQETPEVICPVSGCTISGGHTHNGVHYACNGFHSGGHCDGTCNTTTSLPQYVNTSGHHSESHHSSGHH